MGAEREDTDPKRVGTEPGLGRPSSGETPAAAPRPPEDEAPPPVDFDALHAALGDPIDYQELSSGPALDAGSEESESEELLETLESAPGKGNLRGGDSSGRSSATYASARPHTIPPTRAPAEDLNVPAVIVAGEDTVPSAAPQMTAPLMQTIPLQGQGPPFRPPTPSAPGMPGVGAPPAPPLGAAAHGSAPALPGAAQPGPHPSSGPHAAAPHFAPQAAPFPPAQPRPHQMTVRMPDRPVNMASAVNAPNAPNAAAGNPRRQRTPTLVVRPRGPSVKQKLVAFMAMLLLFTAVGIAMIIWRQPRWLGLDPAPSPSGLLSTAPAPATGDTSAPPSGSVIMPPFGGSTASPPGSAKKPSRK